MPSKKKEKGKDKGKDNIKPQEISKTKGKGKEKGVTSAIETGKEKESKTQKLRQQIANIEQNRVRFRPMEMEGTSQAVFKEDGFGPVDELPQMYTCINQGGVATMNESFRNTSNAIKRQTDEIGTASTKIYGTKLDHFNDYNARAQDSYLQHLHHRMDGYTIIPLSEKDIEMHGTLLGHRMAADHSTRMLQCHNDAATYVMCFCFDF